MDSNCGGGGGHFGRRRKFLFGGEVEGNFVVICKVNVMRFSV